jgi:hypothetical protein
MKGQYYIIYSADEGKTSMARGNKRNSVVTGSFLKHIKNNKNNTFPNMLDKWV